MLCVIQNISLLTVTMGAEGKFSAAVVSFSSISCHKILSLYNFPSVWYLLHCLYLTDAYSMSRGSLYIYYQSAVSPVMLNRLGLIAHWSVTEHCILLRQTCVICLVNNGVAIRRHVFGSAEISFFGHGNGSPMATNVVVVVAAGKN